VLKGATGGAGKSIRPAPANQKIATFSVSGEAFLKLFEGEMTSRHRRSLYHLSV
jgi:hypothetical protein